MSEMSMFEVELITKFRLDRHANVLIERAEDESFADALTRTSERVMRVMATHGLRKVASGSEQVISNAQFVEPYGWVYSVRVHTPDED